MTGFVTFGLAWQLLMGLSTYAVIAGVSYVRIAVRRQEEQERAAARAETLRLRAELADVREYAALERLRLGPRLEVVESVDPRALDVRVPSFTLQPLVENAIRHGIAPRSAAGQLTLLARRNGAAWTLVVADDGAGADPARVAPGTGVGLPRCDRGGRGAAAPPACGMGGGGSVTSPRSCSPPRTATTPWPPSSWGRRTTC